MKKSFTLLFLAAIFSLSVFANPVDVDKAKQVGQSFMATSTNGLPIAKSSVNYELIYTANTVKLNFANPTLRSAEQETVLFYVFGAENNGYVIVAGDDRAIPILGYADNGSFDPNNIPPNMQKWLEGYKAEIRYAIENNIEATPEIQAEWQALQSGARANAPKGAKVVAPLISTKWNQNPIYNDLCPGSGNNKAVTGCVATAMAQVMKYWNYPITGTGFHSYNHSTYGTLSANFGSTTYAWSNMPTQLTQSSTSAQKTAVATLMYHCGVSVDMNYGSASTGGSGAYVISSASPITHCAEHALKTYFNYKTTMQGKLKKNFTDAQWISMLKNDLDAGRPILYAGFGDGGHAFVCDGYDNSNKFHFNWGWSGQNDGYFALNALNPGSGGAGGGSYNFSNDQQALLGIEPSSNTQSLDLRLYSNLSMSSASIWFGNSISVTVKIANYGTSAFQGTFGAAVFNSEGVFVDFLSTSSQTLANGYNVEKTFTNSGGAPFIPGDYIVAIYYKPTNGDWQIVANGSYTNYKAFKVYYSSNIEVNSTFSITTNGGKLIQGSSATVNVDILNSGNSTFYGKFRINLADLDGSHVQNIGIVDAPASGLPADYHYTNGLNFSGTITASPGTYLMEVAYQPSGSSNWYYAGSSDYQNPVFVIVEAAPIQPDIYEINNTQAQAYNLPVNFSGNNANVKTTGSNFHVGTDIDYYKVVLPAGYNYTITPRLYDSYNNGNGQTYTVDALFSVSLNNTNIWSETYDDVMEGNISVENGGTLYFKVAPYFSGSTGTYLLDIQITRAQISDIDNIVLNHHISIFPNPAKDFVTIDLQDFVNHVNLIVLYDVQGREIYSENVANFDKTITLPLNNILNGSYFVQIYLDKGILTKKLILNR